VAATKCGGAAFERSSGIAPRYSHSTTTTSSTHPRALQVLTHCLRYDGKHTNVPQDFHGYRTDRSKLDFTQLRELGIYWDTDYKDMIYALIHANRLLPSPPHQYLCGQCGDRVTYFDSVSSSSSSFSGACAAWHAKPTDKMVQCLTSITSLVCASIVLPLPARHLIVLRR
jgi:hypothetical protein